ncbi:MAG: hypothetical protein V9H69_19945 [Anaerolineae bacterium]
MTTRSACTWLTGQDGGVQLGVQGLVAGGGGEGGGGGGVQPGGVPGQPGTPGKLDKGRTWAGAPVIQQVTLPSLWQAI